jgi:DNA-binding HxlR family transcriptional regulator
MAGDLELSDEMKEEIRKLREEIANLKEQFGNVTGKERRSRGIYIDVGDRVQDYMGDVMESVAEGIHGELDKCIFIGPRGVRIHRESEERSREDEQEETDFPKIAQVMSALGQEHRVRILKELMSGGKYINELEEKLPEITTSTLSSHLGILEEAGLVVQEKVRGRYLVTIPGRTAYKMATRITRLAEGRDQ